MKKIFFSLFSLFFLFPILAYSIVLDPQETPEEHITLLKARANSFKEDKRPKASVGVVLYEYQEGIPYFLIGQENPIKKGKDTFCEMGGSVELESEGVPETFLAASIRELQEETANVYTLDPDYVLKNSLVYYNDTPAREEVYLFIKAPTYHPSAFILESVQTSKAPESQEKVRFYWLKAADFEATKLPSKESDPYPIHTIDEERVLVNLRSFFLKMLKTEDAQEIIKKITKAAK